MKDEKCMGKNFHFWENEDTDETGYRPTTDLYGLTTDWYGLTTDWYGLTTDLQQTDYRLVRTHFIFSSNRIKKTDYYERRYLKK